jgi:hypothetical protein
MVGNLNKYLCEELKKFREFFFANVDSIVKIVFTVNIGNGRREVRVCAEL